MNEWLYKLIPFKWAPVFIELYWAELHLLTFWIPLPLRGVGFLDYQLSSSFVSIIFRNPFPILKPTLWT